MVEQGEQAPPFCLPNQAGEGVCLHDIASWLVLYFYPKDGSSGCTREAKDFSALRGEFDTLGVRVLGMSPDTPAKHRSFIEKEGLALELLSDETPDHGVLRAYGVWQKKQMYGREYEGVVRTTVVIGPDGVVRHVWGKVKVPGHAEAVLSFMRELVAG
ncbi:MAG: peroxiredoxin [Candidatus Methanofastidiosa archaeon]|nr:peroxiredoxin [Candidatus Methanofastidiosa archaeon]MDD4281025.1 peroxiredoxin [Candidatus Methanofastidiosa archaeon]